MNHKLIIGMSLGIILSCSNVHAAMCSAEAADVAKPTINTANLERKNIDELIHLITDMEFDKRLRYTETKEIDKATYETAHKASYEEYKTRLAQELLTYITNHPDHARATINKPVEIYVHDVTMDAIITYEYTILHAIIDFLLPIPDLQTKALQALEKVLDLGANAKTISGIGGYQGQCALMHTVASNNLEASRLLLHHGANQWAAEYKCRRIPFHIAGNQANLDIVKLLLTQAREEGKVVKLLCTRDGYKRRALEFANNNN